MEEELKILQMEAKLTTLDGRVSQQCGNLAELGKESLRSVLAIEQLVNIKDFSKRKAEFRRLLREESKNSDKWSSARRKLSDTIEKRNEIREQLLKT